MKTKFILFISIILIIVLAFIFSLEPDFSSKKYNKKVWSEYPKYRINMAKDIIDSKILIGKDSIEIIKEFGKSHEDIYNNEWKYLLGFKGYLSTEFYFLTIHFNRGYVDNVYIETIIEN